MGGALAKGLAAAPDGDFRITVTARSGKTLESLSSACPALSVTTDNREAAGNAGAVILCVKPWVVGDVLEETGDILAGKTVISAAAGVRDERIGVYVMPNIAAEYRQSVTFIEDTGRERDIRVAEEIFSRVGLAKVVGGRQMTAGLMMSGCGIAYVMRFLRAMTEGGVELGFSAKEAEEVAVQTMKGAAELLQKTGLHPEEAIDRVTTPGGMTIKGLNELEHAGFTSAVIRGLKAPVK